LISRIDDVALGAGARAVFNDPDRLYPTNPQERVWFEVWLQPAARAYFDRAVFRLDITVKPHFLKFPEREVVLALTNTETLDILVRNAVGIAEIRLAKDTPAFSRA